MPNQRNFDALRRARTKLALLRAETALPVRLSGANENAACLWACADETKTAAPNTARERATRRLFMR